jgi:DNA-directed RNA polymerase subunit RPC12/RpoP
MNDPFLAGLCSHCGREVRFPESYLNREVACPDCALPTIFVLAPAALASPKRVRSKPIKNYTWPVPIPELKYLGRATVLMAVQIACAYLIWLMEHDRTDYFGGGGPFTPLAGLLGFIAFCSAAVWLFKCIFDLSKRFRTKVIALVLSPIALMILGSSCYWESTWKFNPSTSWMPPPLPERNLAREKEIREGLNALGVNHLSTHDELLLREAARESK